VAISWFGRARFRGGGLAADSYLVRVRDIVPRDRRSWLAEKLAGKTKKANS